MCLFISCKGTSENPTGIPTDAPTDSSTEAPTGDVYVDDFSSFTIFANGNYTAAFVLCENASELDKQIADKLAAVLKEKTGVVLKFGTEVVDGRGVYIGDFGNGGAASLCDRSGRRELQSPEPADKPIEAFMKGETPDGCGLDEACALTRMMVGAYKNVK